MPRVERLLKAVQATGRTSLSFVNRAVNFKINRKTFNNFPYIRLRLYYQCSR